jgi:hypothetical protein
MEEFEHQRSRTMGERILDAQMREAVFMARLKFLGAVALLVLIACGMKYLLG